MILHFSHIGLTDGRTFTLARFALVVSDYSGFLNLALETASGRRYHAEKQLAAL